MLTLLATEGQSLIHATTAAELFEYTLHALFGVLIVLL